MLMYIRNILMKTFALLRVGGGTTLVSEVYLKGISGLDVEGGCRSRVIAINLFAAVLSTIGRSFSCPNSTKT